MVIELASLVQQMVRGSGIGGLAVWGQVVRDRICWGSWEKEVLYEELGKRRFEIILDNKGSGMLV